MRKIILGGICAVVVLAGAEFTARHFGFGHSLLYRSSASGYELTPDQTVTRLGKTTHINQLGGRGPEIPSSPEIGTIRILSIGDSVANGGTQINDSKTYPLLVGDCLGELGYKVDVLNVAAGGWAIQNEAAWLSSNGLHGASILLLEVNEKDLDQPFGDGSMLDQNPSFPSRQPVSGLTEILFRYVFPRIGIGTTADPGSTFGTFNTENTKSVISAIAQIKTLADKDGARMVIIYWDPRVPGGPDADKARKELFEWSEKTGVKVVRPQLNKVMEAESLFRDGIHPNEKGNEKLADIICKAKVI